MYFATANSDIADDNVCISCPPGTFAPTTSSAEKCEAKSPSYCTGAAVYLQLGLGSAANDNYCVPVGKCAAGYKKTSADPGAAGCAPCSPGTYSPTLSDATTCTPKQTSPAPCPIGTHVVHGPSSSENDAMCRRCPHGTFNNDTSSACYFKEVHVAQCGPGLRVSTYTSTDVDDAACKPCGDGTYSNKTSASTRCAQKIEPADPCPKGTHLKIGASRVEDDWTCVPCDDTTFTGKANTFLQCIPKKQAGECGDQSLATSNSTFADNWCYTPGRCPPGEQVAPDMVSCVACPAGSFNKYVTTSMAGCTPKPKPARCHAGQHVVLGQSRVRNDWRCATCPAGHFRQDSFQVLWTPVDSSFTVPEDQRSCEKKSEVPLEGCIDSQSPDYDPASLFFRGPSTTEDDYECRPTPLAIAMCMRSYKENTQSSLAHVLAGMPGFIQPFTKAYYASIVTPGYARVAKDTTVIVTGSRFFSDSERVPFPQSRALLVLHDPPGGASFSSFTNTRITMKYTNTDEEEAVHNTFGGFINLGWGMEFEAELPKTIIAPFGAGVEIAIPNSEVVATVDGSLDYDFQVSTMNGGFLRETSTQNSELTMEFTYSTAGVADKAGPPSDAFLVPSVWFEVRQEWFVRFTPAPHCLVVGYMGTSLVANADLSGFAFTQANDVETRTLPLLSTQISDVTFRLCCSGVTFGAVECDDVGMCCEQGAAGVGCTATTLEEHCDFKYGARTGDAWKACFGTLEDMHKGVCDQDNTEAACSWGGVTAATLQEHCDSPQQLSDSAACMEFTGANPLDIINAHNDWYNTLDRNYRHQEKASLMKTSEKDTAIHYNAYEGANARYGAKSAVTIAPLQGMAPQHLVDLGRNFAGTALSTEDKTRFMTWNTVGFDGGGSSMDFFTTGFTCESDLTEQASINRGSKSTCITGSEVIESDTRTEGGSRAEQTMTHALSAELDVSFKLFGGMGSVGRGLSWEHETFAAKNVMIEASVEEDSNVMFHLEDDTNGDYFVVSVWFDPDHGTPLFSLDGGASSCQWEVGTAHRTAPSLSWKYLGPDVLPADQLALFQVKLSNSINYYQAGPREWDRPGWMGTDTGYVPNNMQFGLIPTSIHDGIVVRINGGIANSAMTQVYEEFGKGSIVVLVTAQRGPFAFSYPPVVFTWREDCGDANGENKYTPFTVDETTGLTPYAMGMPNPERTIEYAEACPGIEWSGDLLRHPISTVTSAGPQVVGVAAAIQSSSTNPVSSVFLDYRTALADGLFTKWQTTAAKMTASADGLLYSAGWDVASLADGTHTIQARVECADRETSTTLATVVVDRKAPLLLSAKTSSGSEFYHAGDDIVLTFSEPVTCTGKLLNEKIRESFSAQLKFAGAKAAVELVTASTPSPRLKYTCAGPTVTLSVTADASDLVGQAIKATVKGVYDAVGNLVDARTSSDAAVVNTDAGAERARADISEMSDKMANMLSMLEGLQSAGPAASRCTVLPGKGVAFRGTVLKTIAGVDDAKACEAECEANSECIYWNFNNNADVLSCVLRSTKKASVDAPGVVAHGDCAPPKEKATTVLTTAQPKTTPVAAMPGICSKFSKSDKAYLGPNVDGPLAGVHGVECAIKCAANSRCAYWADHKTKGCVLKAARVKKFVEGAEWLMHGECVMDVVDGCRLEGEEKSGDGYAAKRIATDTANDVTMLNKGACSEACKANANCKYWIVHYQKGCFLHAQTQGSLKAKWKPNGYQAHGFCD